MVVMSRFATLDGDADEGEDQIFLHHNCSDGDLRAVLSPLFC